MQTISRNTAVTARHLRSEGGGDEIDLIALALDAHQEGGGAIGILLARHYQWIVRRCTRWVGNRADAEDVAQEVLLRVCSGLPGLDEHARFRAWLGRIVDNQCKTHLARRRWITVEHIERLIDLHDSVSPPEALEGERQQVRLALEQLPAEASQVLYLRFFHDLSLEQIARRLDISLSAAKMRLYRAQDRFAARYAALEA